MNEGLNLGLQSENKEKMVCNNCGHHFTGAFCEKCGWGRDVSENGDFSEVGQRSKEWNENIVSKICKMIAGIYMVLMVLGGLIYAVSVEKFAFFFGFLVGGLFTGMILWGIGEVIRILYEILYKLQK